MTLALHHLTQFSCRAIKKALLCEIRTCLDNPTCVLTPISSDATPNPQNYFASNIARMWERPCPTKPRSTRVAQYPNSARSKNESCSSPGFQAKETLKTTMSMQRKAKERKRDEYSTSAWVTVVELAQQFAEANVARPSVKQIPAVHKAIIALFPRPRQLSIIAKTHNL
jgi:hypothetical protein